MSKPQGGDMMSTGLQGSRSMMSGSSSGQPSASPTPTASQSIPPHQQPNGQRIEAIKQYYNQLCSNLRNIMGELAAPDLGAQKRQVLVQQQEQVQKSLQEFTEKVLKPLASAAAAQAGGSLGPIGGIPGPAQFQQQQQQQQQQINVSQQQAAPINPSQQKQPNYPMANNRPPPIKQPIHNQLPPPTAMSAGMAAQPPFMFHNAPPATRQALIAVQKQLQMIHQQQLIFNQKIHSKNFDSSLSHSHQDEIRPTFDDVGRKAKVFKLVADPSSKSRPSKSGESSHGKTIEELVKEVSPNIECTPRLEDALLCIADDFIDNVTMFATQLAANRKDTKLTQADVELAVERLGGVTLPGAYRSTTLGTSARKLGKKAAGATSNNPHHTRMAQLKKYFSQNPHL